MIILVFPIGLFLMWRHSSWSTLTKTVITGAFAVALLWNPDKDADPLADLLEDREKAVYQQAEEVEDNEVVKDNLISLSKDLRTQLRLEVEKAWQDSLNGDQEARQKCIDDADALYIELKEMHEELQSFRKIEDFKFYGFGRGGKYYPWLEKIGKMKDDPRNKCCLIHKNCVAGELEMLGMEYVTSDGRDTEYSIATSKLFGGPSPKTRDTKATSASYSNSLNWYEGGTLHNATIAQWKVSTDQNKLATCVDFIASFDKSISSMAMLRLRAEEVKICIDIATSGSDYSNSIDVATMAALCVTEMGY